MSGWGCMQFGAINCARFRNLSVCDEASHYPTLLFYPTKDKQAKPLEYRGERTAAALVRFASENVPSTAVVLTDGSFEEWIATDPLLPKVVLFTDKKGIPPLFKFLSYQMKTRISFGVIFKNQLKLLQAFRHGLVLQQKEEEEKKKRGGGGGGGKQKNEFLPKDIVFPSLLAIDDIDRLTGEWIDVQHHVNQDLLSLSLSRLAAQARAKTGVSFRELTARRMARGECDKNDSQFCFLLLLTESQRREAEAQLLKGGGIFQIFRDLSEKFKRDPVKLCWINKDQQRQFVQAFQALPSSHQEMNLVAYRPKRKKYEVMTASLTASSIESFINDVVSGGKQLTKKIGTVPHLNRIQQVPSTPSRSGGTRDEL
ncbi:thioredoxin domain-containing protein [Cystoisospora suis]|uniref:Thioredoxin domain-containing protein n=1 Tax=Cystoisospora suis TaxID=483139 RepID=A0A2C6LBS5_9APIC|nr:thioredoxin domain-containing protein [Cystoisospora suis]